VSSDEVLPGIWRLALDLPWPGAPPANAWVLAAGDGAVVVDTGLSCEGSFEQLTRGLAAAGFALEDVRLVACTHAHADHAGQAAPLAAAAGCELWLHAEHRHGTAPLTDLDAEVARRLAIARRCGLPDDALGAYAAAIRAQDLGIAGVPRPDRVLLDGLQIPADSGRWRVVETPGHAPSHVCLFEPEAGLLLSGDHVLERVSLGFDHGFTPDPVGELLRSLDRVQALGARLCLPGHGEPFAAPGAAIDATRTALHERLDLVRAALAAGSSTPVEVAQHAYAEVAGPEAAGWMFVEALCLAEHLELLGEVALAEPLRWRQA
jgi:glyoxylase-like metal-dependent hydrolase (beta-lactamase superfamily II)